MSKEKITYNEKDYAIVKALKEAGKPLCLADICAATGLDIKPATITKTKEKGLIANVGKQTVLRPAKRKAFTYEFVTEEVAVRENGKPYDYTDGEKKILTVLKDATEPMTLAEIATHIGVEKLTSGAINSLVNKKGNVRVAGETEVYVLANSAPVSFYEFVADVPTEGQSAKTFKISGKIVDKTAKMMYNKYVNKRKIKSWQRTHIMMNSLKDS